MTGPAGDDPANPYRVQAVDRAIDILGAFTHRDPFLSLPELARRAKLSKPTAFRLLATLQARGLVAQRSDNGAYTLGSQIAVLAAVRARQGGLLDHAIPVMRRIRDLIDETVSIAIRAGDARVHLYQMESLQPLRRGTHSGERSPLYAGASNKLLLSAMEDSEIADYLARTPLVPFTAKTITDPEQLWRDLRAIRVQGYAESLGEKYVGGVSLSTPVRDSVGAVVAALYVSIVEPRYTPELRARCLAELIDGARRISAELGYREG